MIDWFHIFIDIILVKETMKNEEMWEKKSRKCFMKSVKKR